MKTDTGWAALHWASCTGHERLSACCCPKALIWKVRISIVTGLYIWPQDMGMLILLSSLLNEVLIVSPKTRMAELH
ncbi:hypothetical protein GB937_009611 [Aspergillus fischeri]|nr:hypothetical protein GB937_009611 [Aspergillus fischeri]